jgi:ABC-type polysaccharide/polyol phosphate export permease
MAAMTATSQGLRSAARRARSWRTEVRLVLSFARRELHSRYRQSALTIVWSVIQPIALVIVYGVVFSQILQVEGDGLPYLTFVVAGLAAWRYFQAGLQQATCFIDRSDTLSKVYFRREVMPLSGCVAALVDLTIGLAAMVVVGLIQGVTPTYTMVALPIVVAVLLLYTAATAVVVATVTAFIRDLAHALPTVNQILFLGSPVMYPESQIPEHLAFLGTVNPVAVVAESIRDVALRGLWPRWGLIGLHLLIGSCLLLAAILHLRSIEDRIVDVV